MSQPPKRRTGVIRPHGAYRGLKSYQTAEIVYDATAAFCDRFIDRRSRTHGQMVQAARSGKQNIAEGSMASGTSSKFELKLVGVARASLEELLLDFQDFLRQHGLPLWDKNSLRAQAVRRLAYAENRSYSTYKTYVEEGTAEVAANTIVCLIHQANYLLDQQLRQLEQRFSARAVHRAALPGSPAVPAPAAGRIIRLRTRGLRRRAFVARVWR